ncbi:MAG: hypothetical protein QY327_07860 [Fimbriimonadaceae bacterium]|nr:MAG: hypothetical protein QY327_07860 [Fimbriimonadaceae bacterium]
MLILNFDTQDGTLYEVEYDKEFEVESDRVVLSESQAIDRAWAVYVRECSAVGIEPRGDPSEARVKIHFAASNGFAGSPDTYKAWPIRFRLVYRVEFGPLKEVVPGIGVSDSVNVCAESGRIWGGAILRGSG